VTHVLRRIRQALRPAVVSVCRRLTLMQDDRRRRFVAGKLVLPLIGRTHEVDGWCMTVDRHDSLGLAVRGSHEVDVESLTADLLSPGDCFLDIGANIGWSALQAARAVGRSGLVVALEPEIDNFGLLAQNVRANLASNVIPLRVAAGRARGWRTLALDADNAGGHSMVRPVDRGRGQRVLVVAPGDLCSLLGVVPRVVKIDVEGAEPEVVAGLGPLLGAQPLDVVLEFAPERLRRLGARPQSFLDDLRDTFRSVQRVAPLPEPYALEPVHSVADLERRLDGRPYTHLLCRWRT
jgi:FkbM family methyltransferase